MTSGKSSGRIIFLTIEIKFMSTTVTMPKYGETMEEGIVTEWTMEVGDTVEEGDIIAEIETHKSVFELEAPVSGTLLKILVEPGQSVPVNDPIAVIGEEGETV
jgi:pyruvate/2-oxoglutarate dehydrogenase complex dihydrolipoamide acyltransferase (E2) component